MRRLFRGIARWTGWLLVWGVLYAAFFLALDWSLLDRVEWRLAGSEMRLATLQNELRTLQATAARRDVFRAEVEERGRLLQALESSLPSERGVATLRSELAALGAGSGVRIDAVSLGAEQSREFYATVPVEVAVRGSYAAVLGFADRVRGLPRPLRLVAFDVRRAPGGAFAGTLMLRAFRSLDPA